MKVFGSLVAFILFCTIGQAYDFEIESFHAPTQYINKAQGDGFTFVQPVVFLEICSNNKILERTPGESFGGNKTDFYLNKKIKLSDRDFPVVVKILVGEKKNLETGIRAAAGGGLGATVGGIIGGCLAGFCTGGLGAPAGAAIGAAIGGGVGAGAALFVPIKDAREVASFYVTSATEFSGTHKKDCGSDILSDGQQVRLIIKTRE